VGEPQEIGVNVKSGNAPVQLAVLAGHEQVGMRRARTARLREEKS